MELVSRAELHFHTGRLKLMPKHPETPVLARELKAFTRRRTPTGRETAEGRGEHDDLVIALALACWGADRPQPQPNFYVGRSQVTI